MMNNIPSSSKASAGLAAPLPFARRSQASRWLVGLLSLAMLTLASCHKDDNSPAPTPTPPTASAPAPLPAGFTEATAQVNGVTIHYVRGGTGEPLVLLHGWPQTWYEWHRIMPQLAQRYTVIVPDTRGSGASPGPQPATGYDTRTLAEDVHQLVRQLGYARIRLVGHDIGLMISYAYAAAYPAEVQKLVLLDAPIPGIEPIWTQVRAGEMLWHFGFHATPDLPEILTAGKEREYLTYFYTNFAFNKTAFTADEVNEFVRSYATPGAMSSSLGSYRAFTTSAAQNAVSARTKLQMPVLALGGQSSFGPLMVPMVQLVADNVQGGSIPDCGHWINEEKTDYLLAQLTAFLP